MKSLVLTVDEMEYEQVFRFIDFQDAINTDNNNTIPALLSFGDLDYATMSNILWVIFVIMMPVLFANLLVNMPSISYIDNSYVCIHIGIAVGVTHKVEEKATLTYLALQVPYKCITAIKNTCM